MKLVLASLLLFASTGAFVQEDPALPRVLFLTHSAGFKHSVVNRPQPEELAHAEKALIEAAKGRYEVIATQDCARVTKESLEGFDAVFFYTTGELPISDEGRTALMDWIRSGFHPDDMRPGDCGCGIVNHAIYYEDYFGERSETESGTGNN